ncbi:MAG: arsenate reductase/protein-tyrosine-phosphatase family protein [Promethearchaeota archaeon]
MNKIKRVLIVCTGNTARSPAGEYLAKYYATKYSADLIFDSAGFINAFTYMQPDSQEYLNTKGIIYSDFTPKILNKALLKKQDLIITMEKQHAIEIKTNFNDIQDIENITHTLKEFNGGSGDIIDPYYENRATYLKVMNELDKQIEKMVLKIIELNKGN